MNCFHFWVSLGYDTTIRQQRKAEHLLWIAFIFEYLWDMTQLDRKGSNSTARCELLSFLSIFGIWHNFHRYKRRTNAVVNCFHFWVSLGYDTTSMFKTIPGHMLWIAFIFEYLWDMTQHSPLSKQLLESCELLSFLSIFGIWHNQN